MMKNIYWIDLNRFDIKTDKSTWLETGESLIDSGFSVYLLCGYKNNKYKTNKYRINIKYFKALQTKGLFRYSLISNIFIWLIKNAKKDDIIIIQPGALFAGIIIKLVTGCRLHLDLRTVPVEVNNLRSYIDYFLFWYLQIKLFHSIPDSYSFITGRLKKEVEKQFNINFNDYVIWCSGVNLKHFNKAPKSKVQKNHDFIVTYIGVITKNRGLDSVIKAISKIQDLKARRIIFRVIGDGPYLSSLKELAIKLHIEEMIDFKGYIPYEDIPDNLYDTDCFICPLPNRVEWNISSPIKVFEYLAYGKPTILTSIPAHTEIVPKEDYIIWIAGEKIDDIVIAIEYAMRNSDRLNLLAKKAPDFIKGNYEWSVQGKKLSNYLRKIYYARK